MKFLFVMDMITDMNAETDSTIEIMQECSQQNIELYWCDTSHLYFEDKDVWGDVQQVELNNKQITIVSSERKRLNDMNLIMMRKEPPYDLNYHYATLLLSQTTTPVLNSPQGLRNANEKLVILNFPELLPPTLVTNSQEKILDFITQHKKIVLKPIHEFGGRNIQLISNEDEDKIKKINTILHQEKDFGMAQQFQENVYEGDKRVFLLNGDVLGVIKRIPKKGDFRANMVIGGTPQKTTLTTKEQQIISTIKPYLIDQGLVLAGVDLVNEKLIEINVTCPTGLAPINALYKQNVTKNIVDFLLSK